MIYKLLTANTDKLKAGGSDELEKVVNDHLKDHWRLQGGPTVFVQGRHEVFAQAVVKDG